MLSSQADLEPQHLHSLRLLRQQTRGKAQANLSGDTDCLVLLYKRPNAYKTMHKSEINTCLKSNHHTIIRMVVKA